MSFLKYFRPESDEAAPDVSEALACLQWAALPYYQVHIDYLTSEIDRPIDIASGADMIQAAVRTNTFREIRAKIMRDVARARETVREQEEESRLG